MPLLYNAVSRLSNPFFEIRAFLGKLGAERAERAKKRARGELREGLDGGKAPRPFRKMGYKGKIAFLHPPRKGARGEMGRRAAPLLSKAEENARQRFAVSHGEEGEGERAV